MNKTKRISFYKYFSVMKMNLPKRKSTRLKNYDYSQNGYYFITICTHNKKKTFGDIVGDGVYDIPQIRLSKHGKIINKYIEKINSQYDNIGIDKYVIMPNHIHLIVKIVEKFENDNVLCGTSQAPYPTVNAIIPKFVSLLKRYCNHEIGNNIFQRSYHDHIIRDENDYLKIWNYINTNPLKWKEDCFYVEN